MAVISARFAPAVAVLLALALVPTVIHSYVGLTYADGRTSSAISRELQGLRGVDTNRHAGWVKENLLTEDFMERRYGADVTLFVARGYDAKRLYHHPELGMAHGRNFDKMEVVHVASQSGSIPVFVLTGQAWIASYALLYDDQFVERPATFELRRAISLLFTPRRQMTLFFAQGPGSTPEGSRVMPVLLAAIESFQAQRPSPRQ